MSKRRHLTVNFAAAAYRLYTWSRHVLQWTRPLWRWLGDGRSERVLLAVEKPVKGLMFDCQMCGQCILNQTGLSCPMNCPKSLRNGPCGGVRANGHCEVDPSMRCVWVEAWRGAQLSGREFALRQVQAPVNHARRGRSSWMSVVHESSESSGS
jgi:hypothetical protein